MNKENWSIEKMKEKILKLELIKKKGGNYILSPKLSYGVSVHLPYKIQECMITPLRALASKGVKMVSLTHKNSLLLL